MTYPNPRLRRQKPAKITPIEAIEILLTTRYNTNLSVINEKTRRREVVRMRQVVQACLARNSKLSLSKIGELTGLKDHATVLNSRRNIEQLEYLFRVYGTKDDLLTLYQIFENRYISFMAQNRIKIIKNYRSYKDELKCTS